MCGTEAGSLTASLFILVVFAGLIAAGVVLMVRGLSRRDGGDQ